MALLKLVGRLCFVAWLVMLVCRVELLQAFGRGTGTNRVQFAPLDVAAYTGVYSARLRGHDQAAKAVFTGFGVPGEAYRRIINGEKLDKPDEVWEAAIRWARDPKMKQIVKPKEDVGSTIASFGCAASIVVALFSPKYASLLFVTSMVALQASLKGFEPSVKFTDTFGIYSIMLGGFAGVVL